MLFFLLGGLQIPTLEVRQGVNLKQTMVKLRVLDPGHHMKRCERGFERKYNHIQPRKAHELC